MSIKLSVLGGSLLLILLAVVIWRLYFYQPRFARATAPTPVFNSSELRAIYSGASGAVLKLDEFEQVAELEYIALPGTVFRVVAQKKLPDTTLYQVKTQDYPDSDLELWIDGRTVETSWGEPSARVAQLPTGEQVLASLRSASGATYVWGGNVRQGLSPWTTWYPASRTLTAHEALLWSFTGLDCSGLLYEATDGYTPRNTSGLVVLGQPVPVAGLSAADLPSRLQPLDLIVWKGHVVIVLDKDTAVESRHTYPTDPAGTYGGVRVRPMADALADIYAKRVPANAYVDQDANGQKVFVVRRWWPENK